MKIKVILTTVVFILFAHFSFSCVRDGNSVNAGVLTPTAGAQTVGVTAGDYFTFTLNACETVTFSFCNNGGSAAWDTQLTVLDNTGGVELAYNDDNCGLQSEIAYTANAAGTYEIQISQYSCNHTSGSIGTMSYWLISPTTIDDYVINNDASTLVVGGENCIQLTPESNDQLGCVWNQNTVDFSNPISLEVTYYFGDNGVNGADGNTFVFKSSGSTCECGGSGGGMGAQGINNSIIIEFDTYDNDNPNNNDIGQDHIAIEIDGQPVVGVASPAPFAGPIEAIVGGAEIDDGAQHTIVVEWDPVSQDLDVYFDGVLRLTANHDFITNVFGGNSDITWGVTSATGGLNNQQYFCPSSVVILPADVLSFTSSCMNNGKLIEFKTGEEKDFESFELQRTYDGMLFETIHSILGQGNNSTYSFLDQTALSETYYRLKMKDVDGKENYSDIIHSSCKENTLSYYLAYEQNTVSVVLEGGYSEELHWQILNSSGQILNSNSIVSGSGNMFKLPIEGLSSGVYFLRIIADEEKFDQTEKMMIR